jgi:hypothetical protein
MIPSDRLGIEPSMTAPTNGILAKSESPSQISLFWNPKPNVLIRIHLEKQSCGTRSRLEQLEECCSFGQIEQPTSLSVPRKEERRPYGLA